MGSIKDHKEQYAKTRNARQLCRRMIKTPEGCLCHRNRGGTWLRWDFHGVISLVESLPEQHVFVHETITPHTQGSIYVQSTATTAVPFISAGALSLRPISSRSVRCGHTPYSINCFTRRFAQARRSQRSSEPFIYDRRRCALTYVSIMPYTQHRLQLTVEDTTSDHCSVTLYEHRESGSRIVPPSILVVP